MDTTPRRGSPHGARCLRCLCLALLLVALAPGLAWSDGSVEEFWPEVDVWLRLSPAWRVSLFVPISENLETHYREGNLILQADYAWGRTGRLRAARLIDENRVEALNAWMVRWGYLGGRSLGDEGAQYTERTIFGELHARTPIKGDLLVTQRLRVDLRWLGDDADASSRWRYRLQVEKEIAARRFSFVPYANVEFYYDSRYETVNRIRAMGGTSVVRSKRFALEANWTYQHDTRSSVTNLDALNLILHVFFEKRHAEEPASARGMAWPAD